MSRAGRVGISQDEIIHLALNPRPPAISQLFELTRGWNHTKLDYLSLKVIYLQSALV